MTRSSDSGSGGLSLTQSMANIGSEVARAVRAKQAGNDGWLSNAPDRALELFGLTLADPRWRRRRREIARAREIVCDHIVGDNVYASSPEALDRYFLTFAIAARRSGDARRSGHDIDLALPPALADVARLTSTQSA